jgi:hypothetical protein
MRLRKHFVLAIIAMVLSATVGTGITSAVTAGAHVAFADASAASPLQIVNRYKGPFTRTSSPPTDTDAVSPERIVELANNSYKIVDRSGKGASGTLNELNGTKNDYLADEQIMWDPYSDRFYFSMLENVAGATTHDGIAWGFSKTATPDKASDFCTYFNDFDFGTTSFPDHEMLGDNQDFLILGSNRFSTGASEDYLGSDIMWISKPPAGTTCPAPSSFNTGIQNFPNTSASVPYSPTAVRQVDDSTTGWVLATTLNGESYLNVFSVTENPANGAAVISTQHNLDLPQYSTPPPAPQAGRKGVASPNLETTANLSESYLAFDPRTGHQDIWTDQTVYGGAGSEVRWYEVNPSANDIDQYGDVSDPSLYVLNGSIAPDRLVNGTTSLYGSDAIVNVSTSSTSTYPAIQAVAITGTTQSSMKLIKQSPGPDIDYTCYEAGAQYCRWGDYSGASPDPGAPTNASTGEVWSINQWNIAKSDPNSVNWRTLLYQAKP